MALAIAAIWYLSLPRLETLRIAYNGGITLEVQKHSPACLEFSIDEKNKTLPDTVVIKNNCGGELTIDDLVLMRSAPPAQLEVTLLQKEDYDAFNFQAEAQQCEVSFKKKQGKLRVCGPFPIAAGVTMKLSSDYSGLQLKVKGHFKDGKSLRMNFSFHHSAGSNCPPMPAYSIFT